ncbi:MAG: DUF1461 domain-containing protein [Dehalococcoidia bacterium]|nr:DUF1461 domain-containing protein [Dehalococcoidia bacterium]
MNQAATVAEKVRLLVPERVARALGRLAVVAFILAIPTFLVTSNVRLAFDSPSLYRYGFEQYNVVGTTGLSMGQLMVVAQDLIDYFNSSQELLDVKVSFDGEQRELFNEREVLHMRDVKGMVVEVHRLQEEVGAYIVGYIVIVLLATRGKRARDLTGRVLLGSFVTVGLLAVGGLTSLVGFEQLFDQFHFLSFASGTWTFDPRSNYLTRLFTEGFFMRVTLFIAVSVIAQALLLALGAWGIRHFLPRVSG